MPQSIFQTLFHEAAGVNKVIESYVQLGSQVLVDMHWLTSVYSTDLKSHPWITSVQPLLAVRGLCCF
jgi:hypothetical protein